MHYLNILLFFVLPRLLIIFLKLLTDWFVGIFQGWFWLILGIIFAPFTLLWYSVVQKIFNGQWQFLQVFILVLAIIIDLFSWSKVKEEFD